MDLATYTQEVLAMLNDPSNQFYSGTNVTNWINKGRVETAKAASCIRLLAPSNAPLRQINVTNGGSGYTTATVTVGPPDAMNGPYVTATATATVLAGAVTAITVTNPGTGYVNPPTVTITGDGTGATAVAVLKARLLTGQGQEVYSFTDVTTVLQDYYQGLAAVIGVLDVAASWGSIRPNLAYYPWAAFQAYARAINQGQSWPMAWSQYSRGENGSVYLFPVPSGAYEMQWDCYCTPQPLSSLQTVDLIPDNWTQAVEYYACYLAYLNAQRKDDANDMMERWKNQLRMSAEYSTPPITPTYYPVD